MKKTEFIKMLLETYEEFESALVDAEKKGGVRYTDEDFCFDQFIRYLRGNYKKE